MCRWRLRSRGPLPAIADAAGHAVPQSGQQEAGDYINQLRVDIDGLHPESFRAAGRRRWTSTMCCAAGSSGRAPSRRRYRWCASVSKCRSAYLTGAVARTWRRPSTSWLPAKAGWASTLSSEAPLLRLVLVRTDEERYHLIYNHHILMDGWSNSQLLGGTAALPWRNAAALGGRYRDYIAWLQRQDAALAEAFWLPRLRQLDEPTRLGRRSPRPGSAARATRNGCASSMASRPGAWPSWPASRRSPSIPWSRPPG